MTQSKQVIRVVLYDAKSYFRQSFLAVLEQQQKQHSNEPQLQFEWIDTRLNEKTVALAKDAQVVCCFVNDTLSRPVIQQLQQYGVRMIALRCAGFNNVDLKACDELQITATRVPAYSPNAVAEFAMSSLMTLNRKLHHAWARVREQNFSLERLVGREMHSKTMGVVGSGRIGECLIHMALGFGMNVLVFDVKPVDAIAQLKNVKYVPLNDVLSQSDVISLHVPLFDSTRNMINTQALARMKPTAVLINTSRGELIDSKALLDALKHQRLGGACIDVFNNEAEFVFEDHSFEILSDDTLMSLIAMPNVLLTSHAAFLTHEALHAIAESTIDSIRSVCVDGLSMSAARNSINKKAPSSSSSSDNKKKSALSVHSTSAWSSQSVSPHSVMPQSELPRIASSSLASVPYGSLVMRQSSHL